jgi:nitrate/nitrite transport system substrate-binding protein
MAILEASRFIEESTENRRSTAKLLSAPQYLDAPLDCIEPRLLGDYADGLGHRWQDPHALRFHGDGEVNLPYLSDGMWFMTQFRRWGLLRDDPDYLGVARQVQQLDLYREAATAVGVAASDRQMRSSQLIDGKVWDGLDPAGYARSFKLHAMSDSSPLLASR